MNPIIRAMMSRVGSASKLLGNASSGTGNDMMLKAPDGRSWQDVMQNRTPQGHIDQGFSQFPQGPQQQGSQGPAPIDRIKAAFDAMRSQQPQPNVMGMNGPAQPDANGVYGADATMMPQQQAPGQPMDLSKFGSVNVPDLQRQQPQQDGGGGQQPGFFMRNAMMQQDPESRAFLNPDMAAKASQGMGASPFAGLFG